MATDHPLKNTSMSLCYLSYLQWYNSLESELTFWFFTVFLSAEMKNLLKYILLSILAFAFYDSVKNESSSGEYNLLSEVLVEHILEHETFVSSPQTDIYPPRQVSTLNVTRTQTSSRHDSSNRHNLQFVKFGKTITSGWNYIAQNKTLIQHSPFMNPGHKLVSLCRFII